MSRGLSIYPKVHLHSHLDRDKLSAKDWRPHVPPKPSYRRRRGGLPWISWVGSAIS